MFDLTTEELEPAPKIGFSKMNCTIISLVPFSIKEVKPQIIPGYFQIPPCKQDDIQVLPIGDSIHWMESPFPKMPPIKLTEDSRTMARSIVNDYIEAQLATDTDVAPGLFWVEGHFTKKEAKSQFEKEIRDADKRQKRWFVNLVKIADDDWAGSHQHKFISDIQRHAARALSLEREWLTLYNDSALVQCPLCRDMVRSDAIIHNICGFVINPVEYEKLKGRIVPRSVVEQLNSIGVK